jgi:outer membrane lipoprotein SlyB
MTLYCKAIMANNGPKQWISRAGIRLLVLLTVLALVACYPAPYREVSRTVPENNGGSSRAPRTQVFFYPKADQTTEQQSRDHYECYNWAIKQTGFDPSLSSIPPVQRVRVVPMPPPGYDTVTLAIAGAVLGALIAGPRHAAGGALIGAAGGAVAGAASDSARQESAGQLEEAYARGDRSRTVQIEGKEYDFRRAMSACLAGRGYSVQ